MKFTAKDLSGLNKLINKYFVTGFDIYFMQGLIVSAMSSASIVDIPKLFFGRVALVPMKSKLENPSDTHKFFTLYAKFEQATLMLFKNENGLTPLVNLDTIRKNYSLIEHLDENEQKNLLSWYLGYFYGYAHLWEHNLINNYMAITELDYDGVKIKEAFARATMLQYHVANKLLVKFPSTLADERFPPIVDFIQKFCSQFSAEVTRVVTEDELSDGFVSYLQLIFACNGEVLNQQLNNSQSIH